MKFDKEERWMVIIYIIVTAILVITYIGVMYWSMDSMFDDYRDLIQGIANLGFVIAMFFALIVGLFLVYLKIQPEKSCNDR